MQPPSPPAGTQRDIGLWIVDPAASGATLQSDDFKEVRSDARKDYRKEIDDRFGLVGSRIGLVEGDVRELQITVINKRT